MSLRGSITNENILEIQLKGIDGSGVNASADAGRRRAFSIGQHDRVVKVSDSNVPFHRLSDGISRVGSSPTVVVLFFCEFEMTERALVNHIIQVHKFLNAG